MPCNLEAEQYVLGTIIFDNNCMADIVSSLKTDEFYFERNRLIYAAMLDISNRAEPIDFITLKSQLGMNFDVVGGIEYLTKIRLMVSTTSNLKYHIKIIKDKAVLRKLINAGGDIASICYEQKDDISVILGIAESKIYDILQNKTTNDLTHIKEVLAENLANYEEMFQNKRKITGVPSGFKLLDNKTTGFQPTDLILIAARPAMGKTSFALNIATNAALRGNVPVAVFSLEMSKEQLTNRILCSEAYISNEKMKLAELDHEDMAKLASSINELSQAPIYIDDTAGITVSEIKAKCRRLKLKGQLGLVVIDYLQLIQGNSRESRQNEVGENSRLLKIMAKELNVPVICLSQLSRAPEQRTDHRPMLSDLRDSGSIEQDADMVMFLYRDDYYNPGSEKQNISECIIAKFRNGSVGTIELGWRGEFTRFTNLEPNR
ncbi:MAG: replicative DNA helicase [Clostridia bacterium]|nr:replicative DNA helicase [Clostridia bacterium]MBO7289417.1 replicative DNA helicase [Clostridia bacterium]